MGIGVQSCFNPESISKKKLGSVHYMVGFVIYCVLKTKEISSLICPLRHNKKLNLVIKPPLNILDIYAMYAQVLSGYDEICRQRAWPPQPLGPSSPKSG